MKDGSGMSSWAAQAVDNINKGNTPYQRRLEFQRKLAMTGITAGIGAVGAVMKGVEGEATEKRQKQAAKDAAVRDAIRNAKLPPNHPDDTPRDEYGLEVARPSYAGAMDNAVRGGMNSNPVVQYQPSAQDAAKSVQASNDANDAAMAAPIAGQWTQQGFQNADMNASVNASDIDRAKAMMRQNTSFGGLGNSFNGGQ